MLDHKTTAQNLESVAFLFGQRDPVKAVSMMPARVIKEIRENLLGLADWHKDQAGQELTPKNLQVAAEKTLKPNAKNTARSDDPLIGKNVTIIGGTYHGTRGPITLAEVDGTYHIKISPSLTLKSMKPGINFGYQAAKKAS